MLRKNDTTHQVCNLFSRHRHPILTLLMFVFIYLHRRPHNELQGEAVTIAISCMYPRSRGTRVEFRSHCQSSAFHRRLHRGRMARPYRHSIQHTHRRRQPCQDFLTSIRLNLYLYVPIKQMLTRCYVIWLHA